MSRQSLLSRSTDLNFIARNNVQSGGSFHHTNSSVLSGSSQMDDRVINGRGVDMGSGSGSGMGVRDRAITDLIEFDDDRWVVVPLFPKIPLLSHTPSDTPYLIVNTHHLKY